MARLAISSMFDINGAPTPLLNLVFYAESTLSWPLLMNKSKMLRNCNQLFLQGAVEMTRSLALAGSRTSVDGKKGRALRSKG